MGGGGRGEMIFPENCQKSKKEEKSRHLFFVVKLSFFLMVNSFKGSKKSKNIMYLIFLIA